MPMRNDPLNARYKETHIAAAARAQVDRLKWESAERSEGRGFDIVSAYHAHNSRHPSTNMNNRHARALFGGTSMSAVNTAANPQTLLD